MRESRPRHPDFAIGETGTVTSSGFLAAAAVVVAGSGAIFGILSSTSQQPLLLTLMAVLAMLGVFGLFAFAAGHLRLTERVLEPDMTAAVAAALPHGVMISGGGDVLYANPAWDAIAGRGIAGLPRSLDHLVAGEPLASQVLFRLTRAAAEGRIHSEEMRLGGAADGLFAISVSPLPLPAGRPDGAQQVVWTVRRVSAIRHAQSERIASLEAELRQFAELPVGVIAFTPEGGVSRINAALASWLGLSPDAARPTRLADIMSDDFAHLLRQLSRQAPNPRISAEIELRREDGRRFPVQIAGGGAVSQPDGSVVVALTPREEDRPALAEGRGAEPRFARLFQAAPFGIATITSTGRIANANAAFGRMLLQSSRLDGRHIIDDACKTLVGDARTEAERALAQALSGQAAVAPIEVPVGPQGEFTRRLYLSSLSPAAGAREAVVVFLIDVTEQKALELKFAQSQKMEAVGKLAGGIAHDFNNVLTAIIGFSDLLLQTHRPTDAAYRDIMNIKSSANRAASMVRQLLAFSRRQTLQTEVLLLGEVITELSPLLNRAIGEKIEIKILPGRDLWYVRADKTQFEQVMINLAVNAGDAMPDGGKLTIRTRNFSERESARLGGSMVAGEYVLVEVEDSGCGMTPEVLSKIFEPFFTTKGVGKGTGLGLATVYGIVKQTGGFIYPESSPGKGTTFRVYLPRYHVDADEEIATQKAPKKERQVDLTGTGCVLLVEDEDVVRNFAARALKRQGYEVLEASTGLEALDVVAANPGRIDIVVSDVVMPEMDGPAMLKELRKTNPHLKIIFVSGYPDDAFKRSFGDHEQFAFLPKPFSLPQLAQKVKDELEKHDEGATAAPPADGSPPPKSGDDP